ncbi:hypothetical protein [Thiocapsa marina]|nr:hypothetical protein [Thiocapsa marina]
MRILKVGTCPSLSGASTLAYHLGCDSEKALHIRIWGNTGGGLFGREWVPWSAVQPVLDTDAPVTAGTLKRAGVCKGKSANTPGFLLAVLKAEGLVETLETGGHRKSDSGDFLSEMQKLIDAGTEIQVPPTKATR